MKKLIMETKETYLLNLKKLHQQWLDDQKACKHTMNKRPSMFYIDVFNTHMTKNWSFQCSKCALFGEITKKYEFDGITKYFS